MAERLEARWLMSRAVHFLAAIKNSPAVQQSAAPAPMISDIQSLGSDSSFLAAATAALPGLPTLHSQPGAATSIYLDFNGGTYGSKVYTPYDVDGDSTTFSPAEQSDITDAWEDISTYFAPFDVDVTTLKPSGPTAWDIISNSQNGGVSGVGAFPDGGSPASKNQSSDARTRTSGIAHELGHNFGLSHQAEYDNLGNQTAEYSDGYDATHGPIMGVDYARSVHKWFIGHPNSSASALQDDLKIITNAIKAFEVSGGDGYRVDDFAGSIASATPLTGTGTFTADGIIERPSDVDSFSFTSAGGWTVIDVNPVTVSSLAPKIELYDPAGKLIGAIDDTDQRNGTDNKERLSIDVPSAGTYTMLVSGHGDYGDIGQYTIRARQLPDGWNTQDIGSVGAEGYATYVPSTGVYTLNGSGADIAGTADEFRYAYVPLRGDGTIIARVTQVQNTDDGAKVGLMIRDSLASGSTHASIVATNNNGVRFLSRTTSSGTTTNSGTGGAFATVWLKLTRAGNVFTGYRSNDGVNWTQVSQATISMGTDNFIGLVTTSRKDGTLNQGKLDSLTLSGNINPPATFNTLAAPSGLTVTAAAASDLNLSWSDVVGETGYIIERSMDGFAFTQVGTTSANITTYNDDKPFGAMRWFYRVSAKDDAGNSVPSKIVSAINTPNAVGSLAVASLSKTQLVVNWRDVSGDTGFRVERSTDGTTFTTLSTVAKNVPAYSDTGLKAGTTYTYRITPVNSQGDGIPKTVQGTTRVAAAGGLQFVERASDHVEIDWNNVTGATGYHVERSTDGTTFTTLTDVAAPTSDYVDGSVSPLNDYYYRITAFNAVTDGDPSTVIWGATPGAVQVPAAGWASATLGNPAGLGASGFAGGNLTILANGNDIGGTADQLHFVYLPLVGNGQIIARVASLENTDDGAEAGVMIRDSLATDSRQAFLGVTAAAGLSLVYRTTPGGTTSKTGATAGIAAPYWLKLVREGTTLTGYSSPDGSTWTKVGAIAIPTLGTNVFIGLVVSSHDVTKMNTSTFTDIAVNDGTPHVTSIAIDDGTAQRSMVRSINVNFDRPVSLDSNAFILAPHTGVTTPTLTVTLSADNTNATLTFSGAGILGGSLADSLYDLTVAASSVHNRDTPAFTMSSDATLSFHRYFGDFTGDRTVNNADAFKFTSTYLKTAGNAGFLSAFDWNSDGAINNLDNFQFNKRYLVPMNG